MALSPRSSCPRRAVLRLALTVAAVAALGCRGEVEGDGVLREETRSVPAFLGVSATDSVQVKVTAGASPQRVVVSGDENVVQHVQTVVHTDTALGIQVLEISVTWAYTSTHPLTVTIDVPEVRLLRADGAAQIRASSVAAQHLAVEAHEGSDVTVAGAGTGDASSLHVVLAGTQHVAQLDARAYPVATATVDLTGSARAEVNASASVDGVARPGTQLDNVQSAAACLVQDGQGNTLASCSPSP